VHGESDVTAHDLADQLLEVADAAPLAEAGTADPGDAETLMADKWTRPETEEAAAAPATASHPALGTATRRPRVAQRHRAARDDRPGPAMARLQDAGIAMRRQLAEVRPRVWALGVVALILVSAGAVALPMLAGSARGESVTSGSRGTPTPPAAAEAGVDATPSTPDASDTADTSADVASAASEDPDVAAPALLRLRADCLRRRDTACLDGADQPGSAADDADRSRIAAAGGGGRDDGEAHLTDALGPARRLGDTALIELRPTDDGGAAAGGPSSPERRPASLLVVRGEAGWRIRDLMDDR
jgi:hypothetical protein